jgi:hypothetical protein
MKSFAEILEHAHKRGAARKGLRGKPLALPPLRFPDEGPHHYHRSQTINILKERYGDDMLSRLCFQETP